MDRAQSAQQQPNLIICDPLPDEESSHELIAADARDLSFIAADSIHLVCTSPPYGALKQYPAHSAQLGNIGSYDAFLHELDHIWRECLRVLVPGGRIACVVGDICVSRRQSGRHFVLPLSGDLQSRLRKIGFDNLTPIRWHKVANISLEASRSARYLGKPNLPNGVVKNDVEQILFFRKPGGYRKVTKEMERASTISTKEYMKLFCPVWADIPGQYRSDHPAPYPVEIPARLIRMFSFVGDTVMDPFAGTGTTSLAAMLTGRNSIAIDVEPTYIDVAHDRLMCSRTLMARIRV